MICMEVDGMKRVLFKVILPLAFVAVWVSLFRYVLLKVPLLFYQFLLQRLEPATVRLPVEE